MRCISPSKSPKKEEIEVPDARLTQFCDSEESSYNYGGNGGTGAVNELGLLGIQDDDNCSRDNEYGILSWELMDWEEDAPYGEDENGVLVYNRFEERRRRSSFFEKESHHCHATSEVNKKESIEMLDGDDDNKKASLNLNLNYQEVLDAWSDRRPLLANGFSFSVATTGHYMGEVPVMEEERTRREASVLRYKEKRQTRLFSKKIRYQVRKLNADKRPRLKGRFVKRAS